METIRNLFRHKGRVALTIFGIAIGIISLTVLGSLAEKMNIMMEGGEKLLTGQITVMPKSTEGGNAFFSSGLLDREKLNKIREIQGVEKVQAQVRTIYSDPEDSEEGGAISFGIPETIIGSDLENNAQNKNWKELPMIEGRMVGASDEKAVTVGYDIADKKDLHKGDIFNISDKDFKVVGVVDKTMTGPDSYIFMDIENAREILIQQTPALKDLKEKSANAKESLNDPSFELLSPKVQKNLKRAASFNEKDVITNAVTIWGEGSDPEVVSEAIEENVEGVSTISPKEGKEMIRSATLILNAMIIGSALIALIVGSLSVINTMIMSVTERRREIGVKKAVGAKNKDIVREYVKEAAFIGFLGGILGIIIGYGIVLLINQVTASQGLQLFETTPRLVGGSLIFAIVLGAIAGVYPAWHAARLDPVAALKDE